jgi:sigma-B regulation protein RsbU (phosphoserine phosphatase)
MSVARILVADDQSDILQALRLLLTEIDAELDTVNSVDDVMRHLEARPYDLLLMDLNYTRDTTSGKEGLELLDRAHAQDPMLPIVVMTGWGSIDTAVEAMRRGAKSFVQKPWDDAVLLEIVQRELHDGHAVRQRDARLAREQEEARLIQRTLLPAAMPQIATCEVAARWQPASGIGGDCYDLVRFSATRFGVSIADVVGKGLPAALLMSNLQAAVRAFATETARPSDVTASVNRLLARNISVGKFVTFAYAIVDCEKSVVEFANAGHNPPLLVRANGEIERLGATGVVLGVFPDGAYEERSLPFASGDRLIFYTDGITEAERGDGVEFGEEQVLQAVRGCAPGAPATLVLETIAASLALWTGGQTQDDATIIVVTRNS